jgi:DNA (cytosine-5)-methyltransferase 1
MTRPRLLDLFCGAGGAAMGYHRAGFDVIGVDIKPQPRYPFEFHQGDAMTWPLDGYDAIHASPPCQDHSTLLILQGDGFQHGTGWMLQATIKRLSAAGVPYVVENVGAAKQMNATFTLHGGAFGLGVNRLRRFQSNVALLDASYPRTKNPVDVTGTGGPADRPPGQRGGIHRKPRNLAEARKSMGIAWMTRRELNQAIPPAYTEHIGRQLLEHIHAGAV